MFVYKLIVGFKMIRVFTIRLKISCLTRKNIEYIKFNLTTHKSDAPVSYPNMLWVYNNTAPWRCLQFLRAMDRSFFTPINVNTTTHNTGFNRSDTRLYYNVSRHWEFLTYRQLPIYLFGQYLLLFHLHIKHFGTYLYCQHVFYRGNT